MLSKILLSIFLFFTSTVFAASADTCAVSHPLPFKKDGALFYIFSISETGEGVEGITNELYDYTQEAISTAGTVLYGFSDISFNFTLNEENEVEYENGLSSFFDIRKTEFAFSFTVIFVAPETGEYTFTTDHVNQGAATFIFDNRDLYCCEDLNFVEWLNKTSHFYYVPEDPMYQTNSVTVHLEKGLDYLMAFTYLTRDGNPYMYTSTTLPSGQVTTNLTGFIYPTYEEGIECEIQNSTSSIISEWTGSYTTTYSTTVIFNEKTAPALDLPYTDVETIYYILTPTAVSSSSIIISSSSEVITSSSSEIITPSSSEIITPSSSEIITLSSSLSENTSRTSSISSSTPAELSSDSSSSSEESLSVQSSRTSSEISSTHASSALSGTDSSVTASTDLFTSITPSSIISSTGKSSTSITITSFDGVPSSDSSKNIDSTINAISSVNSNVNGSANSSSTSHSEVSSTDTASMKSTQSSSSKIITQGTGESSNEDAISTSTYTDVYGMTRTTTVSCSTSPSSIKSVTDNNPQGTAAVTVTTNNNGAGFISSVTDSNNATEVNGTSNVKEEYSTMTLVEKSHTSSASIQLQSSSVSTTASVNIQQAPNIAIRYTVGLLVSFMSFTFQILFI